MKTLSINKKQTGMFPLQGNAGAVWMRWHNNLTGKYMRYHTYYLLAAMPVALALFNGCSPSAPGVFGKKTPHEQYGDRLGDAGLRGTALYRSWFDRADKSLSSPLGITLPYRETGYFSAEKPEASGLAFNGKRGEKIRVSLEKKPSSGFVIYMDLWEWLPEAGNERKLLAASDTAVASLELEVKKDARYILRLQPELLAGGEYTLVIENGPSLAFPVPAAKGRVGSVWGDDRDGGIRRHEGIDIFAPFRSPVIAAADGRVTAVNTNNLGGKVVWLRPAGADHTLYYAHLDEQTVTPGQSVKTGDTLGLVGNTGNARYTPAHLHFGIYATGGAINPLPFVRQDYKKAEKTTASLSRLGTYVRSQAGKTSLYQEPGKQTEPSRTLGIHTLLRVDAVTAGWLKVALPDGAKGYLPASSVAAIDQPLRQYQLAGDVSLKDAPDTLAPRKTVLPAGTRVQVLAAYDQHQYIKSSSEEMGWIYSK